MYWNNNLLNTTSLNAILLNAIPFNILMRNIKQINIKNRTYYLFNDMINIKDFDSSLLKLDKNSCKNILALEQWIHYNNKNWWLCKYQWCKSIISNHW